MKTLIENVKYVCLFLIILFFLYSCSSSENSKNNYLDESNKVETEQERIQKENMKILYKNSINSVLISDNNLALISGGDKNRQALEMRKIDISNCPSDFATAYIDHIHAWEDAGKVQQAQDELKKYADLAAVAGIIATLSESEATPFSNYLEAERELNRLSIIASDEIENTWKKIEHIAVSYGASLPK